MKEFVIDIEARDQKGSAAIRRYRRSGLVPAVAYGRGFESVSGLLPVKEFTAVAQRARASQVFELRSKDSKLNGRPALVRDVQREHLSGKLLHVDLQILNENEEVRVSIPLKIVGEAPGVKLDGGVLSIATHEVVVLSLPKFIPTEIEVDISALQLNQNIHARDLKLSEGVRLGGDADEAIVTVQVPRAAKAEDETAGAAEGAAEGEAAAAAEGDKAAADKKAEKK